MGGLTSLASDLLEKGIEKIGTKIAGSAPAKEAAEKTAQFFTAHTGLDVSLSKGKSGPFVQGLLDNHKDATNKLIGTVEKNTAQHFPGKLPNEIHPGMIKAKASELAEPHTLGKNRELLINGINEYRLEHGDIHGRNLATQLGQYFKEQSYPTTTSAGGRAQTSELAHQLSLSPLTKHEIDPATGKPKTYINKLGKEVQKPMDWGVSPYKQAGGIERAITSAATAPLMPRVGLLHAVGGKLNLLVDSNLRSTAKVMASYFGGDRAGWTASRQAFGAMSEYNLEKYRQWYDFQNRKIPLPDNAFWRGARGNVLSPGLSFSRLNNIIDFGMQGEFEAQYLTKDLLEAAAQGNTSKLNRTKYWMKIYGLDGDRILSQGKLLNEDLATAIDKNIERKLMTDTRNLRWIHAQATPIGRVVRTFNGYKTGQRNFLWQALKHSIYDIKGGNPTMFLTYMGTLGLLYPDVGAALRYVTDITTGKDEEKAREKMTTTWERSIPFASDGYTSVEGWMDRFEAAAHLTAIGMMLSHNRYYDKLRYLEGVTGPVIGNVVEQGADVAGAIGTGFDEPSQKELMRDMLHDTPIAGQYLAGKLLPSKASTSRGRSTAGSGRTRGRPRR